MKQSFIIALSLAVSLTVCPCAAFIPHSEKTERPRITYDGNEEYISVMLTESGKTGKVTMREYLIGCVAAEMSPMCHTEALKAQAAASRTYAERIKKDKKKSDKADITDDPSSHQGYITEAERRERWGDNYDKYEVKIEAAVDAVEGKLITYDGEPALTVYHGISAGKTQSAQNMWGEDYPYLQSVESPGDKLSPDFINEYSFTPEEFSDKLKNCGVAISESDGEVKTEVSLNSDGYAAFVKIGSSQVSSRDIRAAFSLPSTCFALEYADGKYVFACKGNGHGVGMSQYGADYMARQGSSWEEIIMYYYKGVEIIRN